MSWAAVAGSVLDAGMGLVNAKYQKDLNQASANRQMEWQERMSNTSHQREVEDLKKAGLNPILSANAGASTPSGASGTTSAPGPTSFANSAAQYAKLKQEKESIDSQIGVNEETKKTQTELQKLYKENATQSAATAKQTQLQNQIVEKSLPNVLKEQRIKSKQLDWDEKVQDLNNTNAALRGLLGTAKDVKDVINPLKGIFNQLPEGLGNHKGTIFNKRDGVIYYEPKKP